MSKRPKEPLQRSSVHGTFAGPNRSTQEGLPPGLMKNLKKDLKTSKIRCILQGFAAHRSSPKGGV
jgi:hypothetical protein